MARREQKKWGDLSSDISSLDSYSWKNQRQTGNAEPQEQLEIEARKPWADLSSNVSSLGSYSWKSQHQTRRHVNASMPDETEDSTVPHGDAVTDKGKKRAVHFEQHRDQPAAATHEAIEVDAPKPPKISGRMFTGPVDLSGKNFPSGLADIQLPPLPWKNRPAPGFRVPEQLIQFGKDNMRWEADRDLPRDDAFDASLPDRDQSFVSNHHIDHMVQAAAEKEGTQVIDTGPMLYEKRPPSPKLPTSVMENLEWQTAAFVGSYKQLKVGIETKREGLKQAASRTDKATKRWENLRAKNKARDAYIARLEEELAAQDAENVSQGVGTVEDRIEVSESNNLAAPTAAPQEENLDFDQSGVVIDGDVDELEHERTNMDSDAVKGPVDEVERDMSPQGDAPTKSRQTSNGRVSSLRGYFEGLDVGGRKVSG